MFCRQIKSEEDRLTKTTSETKWEDHRNCLKCHKQWKHKLGMFPRRRNPAECAVFLNNQGSASSAWEGSVTHPVRLQIIPGNLEGTGDHFQNHCTSRLKTHNSSIVRTKLPFQRHLKLVKIAKKGTACYLVLGDVCLGACLTGTQAWDRAKREIVSAPRHCQKLHRQNLSI